MSFPPIFFRIATEVNKPPDYWQGFWIKENQSGEQIEIQRTLKKKPKMETFYMRGNPIKVKFFKPTRIASWPEQNFAPVVFGRE